jgi:hypothetical protein
MSPNDNHEKISLSEMNAFLERTLIETYLKGKGYTMEDLKNMPPEEASSLRVEASTYASSKLAEMEHKAHFIKKLYEAYSQD